MRSKKRNSESITIMGPQGHSIEELNNSSLNSHKRVHHAMYSSETYGQYGFKNIGLTDAKLEVGEFGLSTGEHSVGKKPSRKESRAGAV